MYLSGVSSSVFFFFSFCIAAVLQCGSLFAALIVFGQRVGWQHLPQARASPFIRDPRLHLLLLASAGATPSLLQAGGFLVGINGSLDRATGAFGFELSSEDPKEGGGTGVPQAGGCGHGEKGQRGPHTGVLRPNAAFLHHCIHMSPWASHSVSLWFASPSISSRQESVPCCLVPLRAGTFDTYVWQRVYGSLQ